MGCCGGSPDAKQEREKSREIDKELNRVRAQEEETIRILLLGTGESGKSTVLKQMKIIHGKGFSERERAQYCQVVHSNALTSMKALIAGARALMIPIEETENRRIAEHIMSLSPVAQITPQLGGEVYSLWCDRGIQNVYRRSSEFSLNDSAAYFFQNVKRIAQAGYVPSQADLLRARVRTTGVSEHSFEPLGGPKIQITDVGGQRNERRKWIHCFEGVTAVIFCVGLSEFDQTLREDTTQNRMKESLLLFDEMCNCRWFANTPFIIFFNKTDLFREKLLTKDIRTCFPDYTGPKDYDAATQFIKNKFCELNRSTSFHKNLYHHFTCAVDTTVMTAVLADVHHICTELAIEKSGF